MISHRQQAASRGLSIAALSQTDPSDKQGNSRAKTAEKNSCGARTMRRCLNISSHIGTDHLCQSNINSTRASNNGPSYSVKYLGIVDGSMGVLSRKMALLSYN